MRLTQIKLAGFKSFVDPTTLQLASNLTSVVGPNGCGKSNVIDAVRWVTGESNARQLRGEALEDVIFNGSHARKPVGRASVELRFDNSDATLAGQYGAFAEISVRRELTRDGASKYFINNARARRRDVVDLFLGTGLGGRSNYAVIEQGAVNRLVEAKPEDMRQVLEEAAGISKYKERRRETENRIRHTRDNLDRLNDLIGEIAARLATLKRQAASAEKYKTLKADERRLRAELLALRWQERSREVNAAQKILRDIEDELRSAISARRGAESERDDALVAQRAAGEATQSQQAIFYDAQARVGRIEQAVKHARELAELNARQRQSLIDRLATLGERRDADRQRDAELADAEAARSADRARAAEAIETARQARDEAEQAATEAEQAWDGLAQQSANPEQQLDAEKTRVRYATAERDKLTERHAARDREREALVEISGDRLAGLEQEIARTDQALSDERAAADAEAARHGALREESDRQEKALAESRREHGECQASLAADRAMQRAVLREDDAAIEQWLDAEGYGAPVGVARRVRIEPALRPAAQAALGALLHGFLVSSASAGDGSISSWPGERLTLVEDLAEPDHVSGLPALGDLRCLAEGVSGPAAIRQAALGVFVADNWAEAVAARAALAPHQRIVTRNGAVLGPGHLTTPPREDSAGDVQEREQRIATFEERIAALESRIAAQREALAETHKALAALDESRREREPRIALQQRTLETAEAELAGLRLRAEQTAARKKELDTELAELAAQMDDAQAAAEQAEQRVAVLADEAARYGQIRTDTRARLAESRRERDSTRAEATAAERTLAELDKTSAQLAAQRESTRQRLIETQAAFEDVTTEIERFDAESPSDAAASEDPSAELDAAREARAEAEAALRRTREAQTQADETLAGANRRLMEAEQQNEAIRDRLGQARIDVETAATRRQGVIEQLDEIGEAPAPILERLDDTAEASAWQAEIERIEQRISRLGAINLAAIEEYDEAAERERYLADQHADLSEALATLEDAIARIDRETRQRFKATYEQVDARFSEMFPQLFGGGEAALSLTEEDWLNTGVRVMARPPGKRNASIQMLSGGEKALTAVALLFALFELNPAPFCMLDEIDAPLDDANVARFCDLVRTMSAQVQFIVITHNKLTMELAEQLHGVTMAEPGVSRLVSVDIDAALDLAG